MARAAALLLVVPLLAQQPAPSPQPRELDALVTAAREHLTTARKERGFPGVSAAFVLPDGRVGALAIGDDHGRPLTTAGRFLSGSIGKTYVAAVALQLVGEGKLHLDEHVAKTFGGTAWYRDVPNGGAVTLRQLLDHTSGIPDHVRRKSFEQRVVAEPDRAPTPIECIAFLRGQQPVCAPGEKWSYADTNYVLVGLLVEAATGKPCFDVVRERLVRPLALADTLPSNRRDLPGLVNGNASGVAFHRGDTTIDGRYFVDPAFEYCGGGMCSTATDLARWGRALFAGDVIPAALRGEQRAGVAAAPRITERYGLGCFIMDSPHGEALGHSGFMPGFQAMLAHYVQHDLTIALMWNTDASAQIGSPRRAADRLAAVLLPGGAKSAR